MIKAKGNITTHVHLNGQGTIPLQVVDDISIIEEGKCFMISLVNDVYVHFSFEQAMELASAIQKALQSRDLAKESFDLAQKYDIGG